MGLARQIKRHKKALAVSKRKKMLSKARAFWREKSPVRWTISSLEGGSCSDCLREVKRLYNGDGTVNGETFEAREICSNCLVDLEKDARDLGSTPEDLDMQAVQESQTRDTGEASTEVESNT